MTGRTVREETSLLTKNLPLLDSQRSTAERARQRRSTTAMSSLVDLPEHVALRVLSRLDSCDLRALGATCRAFRERMHHEGLSLVEAGVLLEDFVYSEPQDCARKSGQVFLVASAVLRDQLFPIDGVTH